MKQGSNILKNKLLWLAAALLLFIFFPRPLKYAGKFFFSKLLPNLLLLINIISILPMRKNLVFSKEIQKSISGSEKNQTGEQQIS